MSKRVHHSDLTGDDEHDLRLLLEKFIQKSQELEKRESKVLQQVELVQSAVASLRARKQTPSPPTPPQTPPLDLNNIEQETARIREETERIRLEVQEKIEYNKRLQEEVNKRNALLAPHIADDGYGGNAADTGPKWLDRKEIESRAKKAAARPSESSQDPATDFFKLKVHKLQQLERKLKRELEQEAAEARKKENTLKEKIRGLERGVEGPLGSGPKKKTGVRE